MQINNSFVRFSFEDFSAKYTANHKDDYLM